VASRWCARPPPLHPAATFIKLQEQEQAAYSERRPQAYGPTAQLITIRRPSQILCEFWLNFVCTVAFYHDRSTIAEVLGLLHSPRALRSLKTSSSLFPYTYHHPALSSAGERYRQTTAAPVLTATITNNPYPPPTHYITNPSQPPFPVYLSTCLTPSSAFTSLILRLTRHLLNCA